MVKADCLGCSHSDAARKMSGRRRFDCDIYRMRETGLQIINVYNHHSFFSRAEASRRQHQSTVSWACRSARAKPHRPARAGTRRHVGAARRLRCAVSSRPAFGPWPCQIWLVPPSSGPQAARCCRSTGRPGGRHVGRRSAGSRRGKLACRTGWSRREGRIGCAGWCASSARSPGHWSARGVPVGVRRSADRGGFGVRLSCRCFLARFAAIPAPAIIWSPSIAATLPSGSRRGSTGHRPPAKFACAAPALGREREILENSSEKLPERDS